MKVLVVDDDPVSQIALQDLLITTGISNIHTFGDGEVCWQFLQSEPTPLLCCCDVRMPKLGGIDLLTLIREHPLHKTMAFVLVTSGAERSLVEAAIKLGIAGYVVKPFDANAVGERLSNITSQTFKKFTETPTNTLQRLRIGDQKLMLYYQAYEKQISRFIEFTPAKSSAEYKINLDALKTGALTLGMHYSAAQITALIDDTVGLYDAQSFMKSTLQLLHYQKRKLAA